jgi:protein-tyrosine-phosphatase
VIIHFICRGNSFRSIIAEAYLNSLKINDLVALSSGSTAAVAKAGNLPYYQLTLELLGWHGIREYAKDDYGDQLTQPLLDGADIAVCMNQVVYDECLKSVTFRGSPEIWSVTDIGEPGRIARTELENLRYREEAYQEIVRNVDQLISDNQGLVTDLTTECAAARRRPPLAAPSGTSAPPPPRCDAAGVRTTAM